MDRACGNRRCRAVELTGRWVVAFWAAALGAQPLIRTYAGSDWTFPSQSVPALQAPLGTLDGVVVDARNNVYFADQDNHIILRLDPSGTVTTVAGNGIRGFSGDGGRAVDASLRTPLGLAVDGDGNLYVADSENNRIRRISLDGIITTVAGDGRRSFAGDGGPATRAALNAPFAVAVDPQGRLLIVDTSNHRIRRVDSAGVIRTIIGNGQNAFSGDGGPALSAAVGNPIGIAVDSEGGVYISQQNGRRVRKITFDGVISTAVGNGSATSSGDGGPATEAGILRPQGLAFDAAGNLLVCDTNGPANGIRRVNPAGIISTLAGGGVGFSGDGGRAVDAALRHPQGVAVRPNGEILITDSENFRLRRVSTLGIINTLAGNRRFREFPDGTLASQAFLYAPEGVALDATGNLIIADSLNQRLRKVTPAGLVSTLAGDGAQGNGLNAVPAVASNLGTPRGVAVDRQGIIFVAETSVTRIRRIGLDGVIGNATGVLDPSGFAGDNGPFNRATVNGPVGLVFDVSGNLYIADTNNNRIRRVAPNGIITTLAGSGPDGFSGDGGLATSATLGRPLGVGVDLAGNVYIADTNNHRIRKVAPDGVITTIAGTGTAGFSGDGGAAVRAQLNTPTDVKADEAGNIYVADQMNHRVRVIAPNGTISTLAGTGVAGFSGDGGLAASARLNQPTGLVVSPGGARVFVSDRENDRVRVISNEPARFQVSPPSLAFSAFSRGAVSGEQSVAVISEVVGMPFEVDTATEQGGDWLRASAGSGIAPATVGVSVDPASLAPGRYRGFVHIRSASADPPVRTVDVTVTVEQPAATRLGVEPQALSFTVVAGADPVTRQIRVFTNSAASTPFSVQVSAADGGRWLAASPAQAVVAGQTPTFVSIVVSPAALAAGTYRGQVTLAASDGQTLAVPVTLTVSSARQSILLSQTGLTFTAVVGGGTPASQTFGVLNSGEGVLNWTVASATLSGGAQWLKVQQANGSTNALSLLVPLVEVSVDPSGLFAGEYYGQISVSSATAANSPQLISVVLQVLPQGSNPGPVMRPTGLIFTGVADGANPGSQSVTVSNLAATPISYASTGLTFAGRSFFSYVPTTATISPAQPGRIAVQSEVTGLGAGIRRGVITLLFDDGATRNINLLQVLLPAGTLPQASRRADGCRATRLLPLFTLLADNFNLPASWPNTLAARVVDDCGAPLTSGSGLVSFSNGDAPVSLVSLKDGNWFGTWTARNTGSGQVTVRLTAEAPELGVRGSAQVNGSLRANTVPPVITPGAVVSAASLVPQAPVAPGSIVTIFGSRLADRPDTAATLPLGNQLGGATAAMGGRPLPLLYASDGQINAVIPSDIPVNTTHQLVVRRSNSYTVPEPVVVAATQPAMFSVDQSGRGQGLIFSVGGRLADATAPVQPGDIVVIYCTGLGEVDAVLAPGAPATGAARTKVPVRVTIGGVEAEVLYAGAAPGFVGVYQVNALVPAGVTATTSAAVVLTSGGQVSPTVTIAVR